MRVAVNASDLPPTIFFSWSQVSILACSLSWSFFFLGVIACPIFPENSGNGCLPFRYSGRRRNQCVKVPILHFPTQDQFSFHTLVKEQITLIPHRPLHAINYYSFERHIETYASTYIHSFSEREQWPHSRTCASHSTSAIATMLSRGVHKASALPLWMQSLKWGPMW